MFPPGVILILPKRGGPPREGGYPFQIRGVRVPNLDAAIVRPLVLLTMAASRVSDHAAPKLEAEGWRMEGS